MPVVTSESTPAGTRTIPKMMRAAAIDSFGGPEALKLHELPVPSIEQNEVLIAIHTAGVGVWDAEIRGGWFPADQPKFPFVLGTDGSGTVVAVDSQVRGLKPGDAVYSYSFFNPKGGFYAEYVSVSAEKVAPIPPGLNRKEAGAIPTTGLTALQGIDDALHLKQGESILIHAASGGVGTLAVQFAKLRGARIFATASGGDGAELVRRLGADAAVDGHGDIAKATREFAPDGFDAVLAFAGGEALKQCLDASKSNGRFAYPNGVESVPKKHRDVRIISYDAVAGVEEFKQLGIAVEAAKLQVPIAASYTVGDAAKAHQQIAKGHVLGKLVLQIE